MRIDVITIFPELLGSFRETSLLGDARTEGLLDIETCDPRDFATDRHRSVDDTPYGGGPGMVMTPGPLVAAIEAVAGEKGRERSARVLLMSPQGERFDQAKAASLAEYDHLVLVCGRYEGIDQRVMEVAVDEELSIGDYILAGGECAAMVVIEAVARLRPGVLGNPESSTQESFCEGLLEGPQYTRPAVFRGLAVPDVLRSGHHEEIAAWRAEQARERTRIRRPDLIGAIRGEKR